MRKRITYQIIFLFTVIVLVNNFCLAQEENPYIRKGNTNYEKGNFDEAEENYRKSLEKNANSYKGSFNLGDAYYKQGKFSEAANQFEMLASKKYGKDTIAKAYHNLGNSYLKNYLSLPKMIANDSLGSEKEKLLSNSVDAFKNALKNNPKDEDSRYNLAYASRLLKEQQKKNQQNKKDDKKDDKNKNEDDKKNQNKQDDKQEKKEDKQQQQKPEENKISKEDAQRLLDASKNEEKNTQEKLKKEKALMQKGKVEKDW